MPPFFILGYMRTTSNLIWLILGVSFLVGLVYSFSKEDSEFSDRLLAGIVGGVHWVLGALIVLSVIYLLSGNWHAEE